MIAALANFFCPGLGHLILGRPFWALFWFVTVTASYFFLAFLGVIPHIICIVTAAREGRRQNRLVIQQEVREAIRTAR